MKFPETLPMEDVTILLAFFRNRAGHTNRQYAEAAYGLIGYALSQLITNPAPLLMVDASADDQSKVQALEALQLQRDQKVGAEGAGFNWRMILHIAMSILQQISPLFASTKVAEEISEVRAVKEEAVKEETQVVEAPVDPTGADPVPERSPGAGFKKTHSRK